MQYTVSEIMDKAQRIGEIIGSIDNDNVSEYDLMDIRDLLEEYCNVLSKAKVNI